MATWTTELEARVEVDEELKGAFLAALVAAFAEPKPALAFGSGRLLARLEVEADHELEAARLAADRFAKALEKAILGPLRSAYVPPGHAALLPPSALSSTSSRSSSHLEQPSPRKTISLIANPRQFRRKDR
jgi:hypothetical protein